MNSFKKVSSFTEEEEPGGGSSILAESKKPNVCKSAIENAEDLAEYIAFDSEEKILLKEVIKTYHMRIPLYYFSLIKDPSDSSDPIRSQCVPKIEELKYSDLEEMDPLGEEKTSPVACLVHRYPDRALLIVTGRCFMYCRHCTRKRLWNKNIPEPSLRDIETALNYLKENKSIREVIISGGDPLTLPTHYLDHILESVSRIENVEVMRIGTRAPVVFPQRIDERLCRMLEKYDNLWVNVQFNHPREVTFQSAAACRKIQKCGLPISNQSVLLKGINDDPAVMMELCHKLQSIKVRPYYLFQCDPVTGASHFRTSVFKGIEIIEKMRGHTSGMCVPTFVVDGTDGKGKVPLGPNYLLSVSDEGVLLRNYNREPFFYYNPKET